MPNVRGPDGRRAKRSGPTRPCTRCSPPSLCQGAGGFTRATVRPNVGRGIFGPSGHNQGLKRQNPVSAGFAAQPAARMLPCSAAPWEQHPSQSQGTVRAGKAAFPPYHHQPQTQQDAPLAQGSQHSPFTSAPPKRKAPGQLQQPCRDVVPLVSPLPRARARPSAVDVWQMFSVGLVSGRGAGSYPSEAP